MNLRTSIFSEISMSKLRPSKNSKEPLPPSAVEKVPHPAPPPRWQGRVFKNSFTRNGRRIKVKHWSVKIQYRRRRHTFSLLSTSQAEALKEAQEIHAIILNRGWEAAIHLHQLRKLPRPVEHSSETMHEQSMLRTDLAYWNQRLIERKYTEAKLTPGREWAVRIEHGAAYHYFPLGTGDREKAANQALKIYLTVVEKGWKVAFEQFSREITVAIFWAISPIAVTYTTIYSLLDEVAKASLPAPQRAGKKRLCRLVMVEPEAALREALVFWLNRQPGFECREVWSSAEDVVHRLERGQPDLVLVNRLQPGMQATELLEKLKMRFPELPVFTYGIYEDSDQIFIRLGGVTAGYILRRRTPVELLEPIRGTFLQRAFSAKEVSVQIRNYFQDFFGGKSSEKGNAAIANLTDRELKVLNYVSRGYLDKEIAHELGISVWTVHNHLKNTYEKLNVHTRMEAALKYLQK
jgi:DNA-binding NarL/FixJ family response regulator